MQTELDDVIAELAPQGTLRVAINFGNPVLAQQHPTSGAPMGVSADLATELARRLNVALQFKTYDSAGKVFADADQDAWDVAFMAIDPVRAEKVAFTRPYVIIEGTYLVRADSPLASVDDVDRPGTRVSVGKGAAYDLYLTRTLQHADIVRAATSAGAVDLFVEQSLDAAAGVRQPLQAYAAEHPGFRVMEGRFTAIEQAMATPRGGDAGLQYLKSFVEVAKASGFVASALQRSGQQDATVAP